MGGFKQVREEDRPVSTNHPSLQVIRNDDKIKEEDTRRTIAIKLDAFNSYLQHPELLQSSKERITAINLYREILELADGNRGVFNAILPITFLDWHQTKKDTFFCIAMMNADSENERSVLLVEWARVHEGISAKDEVNTTPFIYYFGNRERSSKLGRIYADLVLGEEKTQYLKELGIEHFLRYSPGALERTIDFFQGKMAAGEVNFVMYSKYDYNGAFNNNFIDFWEMGSKGGRVVVMEWDTPQKLVDGLTRITEQLETYKQKGKIFTVNTGIIGGHGNLESVGGTTKDKDAALDIKDRKIFDQLKMLATKIKFERLIINACSTLEEKNDPDFISIAEMIRLTGLAKEYVASVRDAATGLEYNENNGIIATAEGYGRPAYKKIDAN